jgi:DNA-directed RNA polymerase
MDIGNQVLEAYQECYPEEIELVKIDGVQIGEIRLLKDFQPMIEGRSVGMTIPPLPWTILENKVGRKFFNGGHITSNYMKNVKPIPFIKDNANFEKAEVGDVTEKYTSVVNAFQYVPWTINEDLLKVLKNHKENYPRSTLFDFKELPTDIRLRLGTGRKQLEAMERANNSRELLINLTFEVAELYLYGKFELDQGGGKMYPNSIFYLVSHLDNRGRHIAKSLILTPYGSQLERSLLQFSQGVTLKDPQTYLSFLIQGSHYLSKKSRVLIYTPKARAA